MNPFIERITPAESITRRTFLRRSAMGAAAAATAPILGCGTGANQTTGDATGPAAWTASLDRDWLFGGKYTAGADEPSFRDQSFTRVTLPHCVTKLSWESWDPASWQDVWIYRRHFRVPFRYRRQRVILDFDRVMTKASPTINGHPLPAHLGGYLPFQYEVTDFVEGGDNLLAIKVDSQWLNIPPDGSPKGAEAVDYLEPGGITGSVRLRVLPQIFIGDLFARSKNVLDSNRSLLVSGTLDAADIPADPVTIRVELRDGEKVMAQGSTEFMINGPGGRSFKLALENLGNIEFWETENPRLYSVAATLFVDGRPVHDYHVRIGFREARFDVDGFFLNGRRCRLFGLNRHEVYPYAGLAMPERVMRRDAQILKQEFNCNIVRCSHYPQATAFLDACDELGLMVWEETPGWGFLGDEEWKKQVVQNVTDMVLRDRNHPSIVVWGVRVNESKNDGPLYEETTRIAKNLDGTRACSGSMTRHSTDGWHEDIFALDDYHSAKDGSVGISPPLPGVPYMLSETVGQFAYGLERKGFINRYRRAGDPILQSIQAVYYAQAHDRAAAFPRFCGVIAWCAFDYSSLKNAFKAIKCPGVADVFRIPKLGAAFYQAQVSPEKHPVIQPCFYWDFGPQSPRGPGKRAAIFSNCDRLELFVAEKPYATVRPDREHYPNLLHAPFFCDLDVDGTGLPPLRIDGYVGDRLALSKSYSADSSRDQLLIAADDSQLNSDGADATRLVFQIADQFGQPRAFAIGDIVFELSGPGVLVGDNPFSLADSGGVGAVWIRSVAGRPGLIQVRVRHALLGEKIASIQAV